MKTRNVNDVIANLRGLFGVIIVVLAEKAFAGGVVIGIATIYEFVIAASVQRNGNKVALLQSS